MEKHIGELIEAEVQARIQIDRMNILSKISTIYEIPLARLVLDTTETESVYCRGVFKNHTRCLKKPKENGFCGFHANQYQPPLKLFVERVEAPWSLPT